MVLKKECFFLLSQEFAGSPCTRPRRPRGEYMYSSTLPWTSALDGGGPLCPRERPGTHCIGGWVGPGAGLGRCGKSRATGFRTRSDQKILGQSKVPFCRSGNIWLLRFEKILDRVPEFGVLGVGYSGGFFWTVGSPNPSVPLSVCCAIMEVCKDTIIYKPIRPGQQLEIKSHRNGKIESVAVVIFPWGKTLVRGGNLRS